MVNPVIHPSSERSTRFQARRRYDVLDRNEEDQVRLDPSLQRLLLIPPSQLSQGNFSRDNRKPLTGSETKLPIYETKVTEDSRIVVREELLVV